MTHVKPLDHVGITVADLDTATRSSPTWVSRSRVGLSSRATSSTMSSASRTRGPVVVLRPPVAGPGWSSRRFVRPPRVPGSPSRDGGERDCAASASRSRTSKGVDSLAVKGYRLVGGIGRHEDTWLMAHVRVPEGIVVSLTERIG